jgi:hypothetical protein
MTVRRVGACQITTAPYTGVWFLATPDWSHLMRGLVDSEARIRGECLERRAHEESFECSDKRCFVGGNNMLPMPRCRCGFAYECDH